MREWIIQVNGYSTIAHIYSHIDGLYMVTIDGKITGIGGANLKQVIQNTRKAIKRRG